ncbi:unnamed protein product [Brassica rapa]|uniref:Uncharacterized protein n=2 Tax=Brassica TaxID=3705 RepID=A0A3P5XTX9_BRACM|nr:unnamed protein product [Brassica napus]CAG7859870.1 unnamed protein product [Brassica rapa]CDY20038.1 BnaA09g02130D [Brassica napus]VDC58377.1 unnamed protein product [Brassica rapa]
MLRLVWVTRQSNNRSNIPSVSHDHLSGKDKCTASVSNDLKPRDEVKASSSEEPENTNVTGDDNTLEEQETKESDHGNDKGNNESIEGASEAVAVSEKPMKNR